MVEIRRHIGRRALGKPVRLRTAGNVPDARSLASLLRASLDLERRTGRAPEKALGKWKCYHFLLLRKIATFMKESLRLPEISKASI